MRFVQKLSWLVCSALLLMPQAGAQQVFVFPSQATATQVFTGQPFGQSNSFTSPALAFDAAALPNGSKYYVVSRAGTDTLISVNGTTFAAVNRLSLGTTAEAVAVSPDSRRVLVAAGTLRIIDTSNDTELASVNVGGTPVDVAVSIDGRRAYAVTSTGLVTAVDLTNNQVVTPTVTLSGGVTGIRALPNGSLYVTATNRVFEVDGNTMTVRGEIALNGRPGKLHVLPNGTYAIAANQTPVTGGSLYILDLAARAVANQIPALGGGISGSVILDDIAVVSDVKAYATIQGGGPLYELSLNPANITAAAFGSIDAPQNVIGIVPSSETPPRSLFMLTPNSLFKLDATLQLLQPTAPVGQLAVTNVPSSLAAAGPASTAAPASLRAFNQTQSIATGVTPRPLIIRALDAEGRPVRDVPVGFTTTAPGVTFQSVSTTTNGFGYAVAVVGLPTDPGTYNIQASAGASGALTANFAITVGTGTGTAGGIALLSGNGQLVRQQFLIDNPIVFEVRDINGAVLPGAGVTFTLTEGQGTLTATTALGASIEGLVCQSNTCTMNTNSQGQAAVAFLATSLFGVNFASATITANYSGSTATAVVTTFLTSSGGSQVPDPTVQILKPLEDRVFTVRAGETLPAAAQAAVVTSAGQGIPNVGISVTTGLDATVGPTARCAAGGKDLSDAAGVATCDIVAGPRIGEAPLTISVGGAFRTFANYTLRVTPGAPTTARVIQGNNQTGSPGQQLPLALLAEVTDAGGNLLAGAQGAWEVVTAGTLTLVNSLATTDTAGRVSTLVRLGSTPGSHQVRYRAGAAIATFTVTVNVQVTGITAVSGSGQTAIVNQPFAAPLVVLVTNAQSAPVPGVEVSFGVSGGTATLSAASAVTNAQGQASVSVTAGGTAGPITVAASIPGGVSTTFSLTSRLPGPEVTPTSFFNAAGNQPGAISPGSLATVVGRGLAPGLQGCMVANASGIGVWPGTLNGVQIVFGATPAPIHSVCNVQGQERVTFQVPFEIPAGSVGVTVNVSGSSTTVAGVPVREYAPGIFEHMVDGRRYAVLQRADGSFVSATNRARRGELLRLFAAGLGQTTPATGTNRPGMDGQAVAAPLIVGVNNAGARVVSSETLPGMVGVYMVVFEVPLETTSGDARPFELAVISAAQQQFLAQASLIAIE